MDFIPFHLTCSEINVFGNLFSLSDKLTSDTNLDSNFRCLVKNSTAKVHASSLAGLMFGRPIDVIKLQAGRVNYWFTSSSCCTHYDYVMTDLNNTKWSIYFNAKALCFWLLAEGTSIFCPWAARKSIVVAVANVYVIVVCLELPDVKQFLRNPISIEN